MGREGSSIFSAFVHLSLLRFLFVTAAQARKLEEVLCSSTCGEIRNISYPFRLKGDPSGCGDPDYELSCQNNKTILEFHSGIYYVKRISYTEQIIRVVDVNLASGTCSLPNKPLSHNDDRNDPRYYGRIDTKMETASFMNCSRNIKETGYRLVPCLSNNQSYVYVRTGSFSISMLPESCLSISVVPILDGNETFPSYDTIRGLLKSGFDLGWSLECRNCFADGGSYCLPSSQKPYNYLCVKAPESVPKFIVAILKFVLLIVITFLLGLALVGRFIVVPIGLIVFLIYKYRTTKKTITNVEKFLHNQQSWMPKRYTYIEITAITNHFRDKLGQGGFGSVYKGQLSDGSLIAVKLLENSSFSGEEFINEVSTIGRIHHDNVVRLLGFCSEGSKRALIYGYMSNGSLDRHIFLKKGTSKSFSWEKLNEIALGTARGIQYLHEGCDVCILHFDIKPHNILLDANFNPKVADFGLAKFYPKDNDLICVSKTRGTIGYIAPELISRNFGAVSCKSDVYGFGMLLLEMAGGRKNSDANATRSSKAYFPAWVYDQMIQGRVLELQNLTENDEAISKKLCMIGLWCIQVKATDRPSISKVVEMLEGSIDDLEMPNKPFFSSYVSAAIQPALSTVDTDFSDSGEEYSYADEEDD